MRAALYASLSRLDGPGLENRDRWSVQLPLSVRLHRRLSALVVPSYSARSDYLDAADRRGTSAVGVGVQWRMNDFASLDGEWIAQTSGVTSRYQGMTLGLTISTSKHDFQVVLSNSAGITTDLYLPGGDLDAGRGNLRLGFSISRLFDLKPGRGRRRSRPARHNLQETRR